MFTRSNNTLWMTRRWVMMALILACATITAHAQGGFNSGSTGSDGAFAPTSSQTIQVPASGVFNYTTVNIPSGVVITYQRNANNTPVILLASGNVTIAGQIIINGQDGNPNGSGGAGGPGGFSGGTGGYGFDSFSGITGDGPGGGGGGGSTSGSNVGAGGGGGYAAAGVNGGGQSGGQGGPRYGASVLLPLIGGSGGGGGGAIANNHGGAGGGGGGAILIASSGNIILTGAIVARGGIGRAGSSGGDGGGGGGAGGAIRLVTNTISGSGILQASGGSSTCGGICGGTGAPGYIRVEAFDYSNFNPGGSPSISFALPNPAIPPNMPRLRIASVAGIAAPAVPVGSLRGAPDIIVPTTQTNPVNVVIEGMNVPLGTVLQVTLTPENGARTTVQSSPLTGTLAASTATASLSLPPAMSVISANAVINLQANNINPFFINGERVNRIEIAAAYGGESTLTYITQTGRRIRP